MKEGSKMLDNINFNVQKIIKYAITLGVVIAVLMVLNIGRNLILKGKCESVDNAFIGVLSGEQDLSKYRISDKISTKMLDYQKENTFDDDYKVIICNDVRAFNEYLQSLIAYNENLNSLNIDESEGAYITQEQRAVIDSFDINSSNFKDYVVLDEVDFEHPNVHEENNTYYIYLKDVFYDNYNQMVIKHKGYGYTIKKGDIQKPCYFRRGVSPAQIVDTKDTLFKHKMLCYDVTNKSVTLVVKKGLLGVNNIEVAERGEFYSE